MPVAHHVAVPIEQGSLRLLTNGQTIFDRYRLKMLVGKGGMGVVWRAEDLELNLDIALKFLAEEFLFDASAIADLKRETRRGMTLAHPNIVRIFGFFQSGNYAAIAMEYVEGNTLGALQGARREPFFEVDEVADWVRQLCGALDYAHNEAGLVHRDLKPGNLMLDARARLKVADFGIAAELNSAHTRVAGTSDTRGTLSYMSPQQLLGQRPCVDHDIYALGATIYDLLTGRPVFSSGDVSLQVRTVVPPSIAARRQENGYGGAPIPPAWEETITACLAKDASVRPASAAQVAERLGLAASGFGTRSPHPVAKSPTAPLPSAASAPTALVPTVLGTSETPPSGAIVVSPGAIAAETNALATADRRLASPPAPASVARQRSIWIAGAIGAMALVAAIAVGGVYFGAKLVRDSDRESSAVAPAAKTSTVAKARVATTVLPMPADAEGSPRQSEARPPPKAVIGPDGHKRPPPFGIAPRSFPPEGSKPVVDRPVAEHPMVLPGSGIELLWIPRGNNAVGVPSRAEGPAPNEYPLTDVFFSEGFWLGKHEVSRGQFSNVMGFNPSLYHLSADYPVSNVTWEEAVEFCRKLSASERAAGRLPEGYVYTLPTEAQWEYAAKSGFVERWGPHEDLEKAAWGSWAKHEWPQPRGKLEPNTWGLHDMYGNVSEWCLDWYADRRPGGRVDDYQGPASGTLRLHKGGSYADGEFMMRASVRVPLAPGERDPRVGFRLALIRRAGDK